MLAILYTVFSKSVKETVKPQLGFVEVFGVTILYWRLCVAVVSFG